MFNLNYWLNIKKYFYAHTKIMRQQMIFGMNKSMF